MALLHLGTPPTLKAKSHRDYLPWLAHRCWDRACAYCLENGRVIQVDHVEPESLKPKRAKDPTNLLPACGVCNGPLGKWDYHPDKSPRKKRPDDNHGFAALDPRVDDLAALYELDADGRLSARPGEQHKRALWNLVVLFRLDRKSLREWRQQTQELAWVAEQRVEAIAASKDPPPAGLLRQRDVLVRVVAERLLFFELFELRLSDGLRELAMAVREAGRGEAPT